MNENYLRQEPLVYKIPSANVSSSNEMSSTSQSPTPSKPSTSTLPLVTNEVSAKVDQYSGNSITIAVNPNETPKQDDQNKTQQEIEDEMQPHLGARFSNGTLGYVANLKSLQQRMIQEMKALQKINDQQHHGISHKVNSSNFLPMSNEEYEYSCNIDPLHGFEKAGGFEILTQVLQPHLLPPFSIYDGEVDSKNLVDNITLPKVLCSIYTTEANHDKIEAVGESWGWRCDGFLAASNSTNDTIGAVNLTHLGPEKYKNMWQKTRSIFAYIHDHYLEDYDFFWLGGDDAFMIVENLRFYLWNLTESIGKERVQNEPLYLGHRIYKSMDDLAKDYYYLGGGPGYILNRYAVKELVTKGFPTCFTHTQASFEDRMIANCLRSLDIRGNHSVDEENRQIFHGMDPNFISWYNGDKGNWFFHQMYNIWGQLYGYKAGKDLVSKHSITFHNVKFPLFTKRLHALVYNVCPQGTIVRDAIDSIEDIKKHDSTEVEKEDKSSNREVQANHRKFVSYTSSKWEQLWFDNIAAWEEDYSVCDHLKNEQASYLHDFLTAMCTSYFPPPYDSWCLIDDSIGPLYYNLKSSREVPFNESMLSFDRPEQLPPDLEVPAKAVEITSEYDHIFSQFVFLDEATGEEYVEYIEPLVSDLRFPLHGCLDKNAICKKRYNCPVSYFILCFINVQGLFFVNASHHFTLMVV